MDTQAVEKMQCDVYMAAINYLNKSEFINYFHSLKWQSLDSVQLMLKDERENKFTVYEPTT